MKRGGRTRSTMRAQAGRRAGLVRSSDECRAGSGGARGSGGGVERGGAARTNRAHGAAAALLVSSSAQPCSAQPSSLEWLFTSLGRSRSSPTIRRATNRARDVSPLNSACASRSQTSRARLAGHTCSNAGPTSARDAESWCACYGPCARLVQRCTGWVARRRDRREPAERLVRSRRPDPRAGETQGRGNDALDAR